MGLERGSRAELAHAALDHTLDGIGLVLSEGEKDNLLGLADRTDTHRERAYGNVGRLLEEAGVVLDRLGREVNDARARSEGAAGLVERDVAVGSDAENLKIDAARLLDLGLVRGAFLAPVLGETVENVGIGLLDVDLVEEVLVHEVAVALIVRRSETVIFVEVPALDVLEGYLLGLDVLGEAVIHLDRGGACRETQYALGILLDELGDHISGLAARFLFGLADYDFHFFTSLG